MNQEKRLARELFQHLDAKYWERRTATEVFRYLDRRRQIPPHDVE